MMTRPVVLGVIAAMFVVAIAAQSRQPAGTSHNGKAFRFNKVKEGVYHAVGTGSLAVVGNSSFIVNDNDVIVVDDHVSPAAAWVLLEEIKEVTNKPVTTVINTHFHFDHAHGNQIFEPNVQIIGHEFTRRMLLNNSIGMPLYRNYLTAMPGQIEDLGKRIASEADSAGLLVGPEPRTTVKSWIRMFLAARHSTQPVQKVAPQKVGALSRPRKAGSSAGTVYL